MAFNSPRRPKSSKISNYDKPYNKPGGSKRNWNHENRSGRNNDFKKPVLNSNNHSDLHPSNQPASPFYLYGIHPVKEAIKKNYTFKRLYLQKSDAEQNNPKNWDDFINYCQKKKIQFRFVEKSELDQMMREVKRKKELEKDINHQGVVAELKEGTRIIQDLPTFLEQIPRPPSTSEITQSNIILITDHITDQQNFGAITRSAFYFGCPLIITEDHHSAPIDSTVHKTSSGASLLIPFYQCEKISQAINLLKKQDYHIIASSLSENSTPLKQISFKESEIQKIALIMGAEGEGVRPLLLRLADQEICIENHNDFDSLNVSVATGILLYQLSQKTTRK